ncbi:aspartate kinase [Zobellella sp. DQSA1]|uniref:aspartate kinase n=1 Tax=Zobellella sp. DQSA1 TaxID=3342386 RepID=UPI0035BF47D7
MHTVEKIGGTSMSQYDAVRDNIILKGASPERACAAGIYNRMFVVSAYGGITDRLLENKRTGEPGIFGQFANHEQGSAWQDSLQTAREEMTAINRRWFGETPLCAGANRFICARLDNAETCLKQLETLCHHGHFSLQDHLQTVREMLASIGEAHSAWNMASLLQRDGINAVFVDLTGWQSQHVKHLDDHIRDSLARLDTGRELPIITGYARCLEGLMSTFDRGYSEIIFSRIAVISKASEAVIHKEYHLSSADPRVVGSRAVPIGRTNYDVADQLANLGMEAIHPNATKGLRRANIPLRVKNTFEPKHSGTLITNGYTSEKPHVEIIAGCKNVYALELFDQDMMGKIESYDRSILAKLNLFKVQLITKDTNANTITHYLASNLKTVKRIQSVLTEKFPDADIGVRKVAILSAIGSDMHVPGILAKTVTALAAADISVLAIHQSMRQVDIQFVVAVSDYEQGVRSLHRCLVEEHDHGIAVCAA